MKIQMLTLRYWAAALLGATLLSLTAAVALAAEITGTPVNDADYKAPFAFTGKLSKITLTIDRPKLSPEDEKRLMQAMREKKAGE